MCPTEFVTFAGLAMEFADRKVALLGDSLDSGHGHLARGGMPPRAGRSRARRPCGPWWPSGAEVSVGL
ncbi:hypothetical protein [Microtetraspora glauca]|uniref:SGNH hydrolase-type esterase domain-containing protein n=1 Tax=Microtetraspora glauca TaxID=1996 RepID=A0ABV3GL12_MICGL